MAETPGLVAVTKFVRPGSKTFASYINYMDRDEARKGGARVIATGRSDFPNQINNVLVFPGVFKGALSVRAKEITELMKQRASYAIASMIPDEELTPENIIASPLNKGVADVVAKAVADTAIEEGIARI